MILIVCMIYYLLINSFKFHFEISNSSPLPTVTLALCGAWVVFRNGGAVTCMPMFFF